MAIKIGSLFGDVSLRTANLDKGIEQVGKKLKKLGDDMQKLGKTLSVGITAPIVGFGTLSVKAFAEQEKAEAGLRAALEASGQGVGENLEKIKGLADEIQKVTTVGDETSISLAAIGTTMGLTVDQMKPALEGAVGLSESFGISLQSAMRMASGAMMGQTEQLTRYLPELKGIADPAEKAAIAQQSMADAFLVAQGTTDTVSGKFAQLSNAFGDLQEKIGAIVAEYLTPLVDKMQNFVVQLNQADPAMVRHGVQIAAIAAVIGPALIVIAKLAAALSSVWVVGALVAAGVAYMVTELGILEEAGAAVGQLLYDIWTGDIVGAIGSFLGVIGEVLEVFLGPFGLSFSADKVRDDFVGLFETAKEWADKFLNTLSSIWNWLTKITEKLPTAAVGHLIGDAISSVAFRADGGPVSAGSPYVVGEEGPELFVPRASGTIIPNGATTGGMVVHQHFGGNMDMAVVTALKNMKPILTQWAVDGVREDNLRRV